MNIPDLQNLFSWNSREEIAQTCHHINAVHIRYKQIEIQRILSQIGKEYAAIIEGIQALPGESQYRLLMAPDLMDLIIKYYRDGNVVITEFLETGILTEGAISHGSEWREKEAWSCLGDYQLKDGEVKRVASTLRNGLIVDFDSPFAQRPLKASAFRESGIGPATPMSQEDRSAVLLKLERTIANLARTSMSALEFVTRNELVVMPRRDLTMPDSFTSSSNRAFINRVTLVNPHLEAIPTQLIANGLIHEAVHSFLYKIERMEFLIKAPGMGVDTILQSPWSGGHLNINTYIHAIFVYYALLKYWHLPEVTRAFSGTSVLHNIAATSRGFENGKMLKRLMPHRQFVNPTIFEQIDSIQKEVA